ncbi:MAG TPA: CHAD domain-containing protein [Anaerolineales bacterium]|nr:CHAD domain-containing protein [Anaerolineales bacterium]
MKTNEDVMIAALDERWNKYREQLRICKREFSEEAVHDLRVATRRLLAVMDILRALDPHPRVQKARRALKNQLDSLDDLRDTQVMLVDVSESMADLPDLKSFEEYLLAREKKLLRKARREIQDIQLSELKRRIEKSRASLEENAKGSDWTARLLSVVDQAYTRAMQAFGQIEASQPASIHRFRVAFKKFRYMVEIVNPALQDYPAGQLKQMHDYQSRMGDVQDAEVFLGALAEFVEHMEDSSVPAPVRESFENHRAEMIAKFMEGKEEIQLFWRAAPEQDLPWEKNNEPVFHPSRNRSGGGNARIRKRQPAPTDRQGKKENAEDRTGIEGTGRGN